MAYLLRYKKKNNRRVSWEWFKGGSVYAALCKFVNQKFPDSDRFTFNAVRKGVVEATVWFPASPQVYVELEISGRPLRIFTPYSGINYIKKGKAWVRENGKPLTGQAGTYRTTVYVTKVAGQGGKRSVAAFSAAAMVQAALKLRSPTADQFIVSGFSKKSVKVVFWKKGGPRSFGWMLPLDSCPKDPTFPCSYQLYSQVRGVWHRKFGWDNKVPPVQGFI